MGSVLVQCPLLALPRHSAIAPLLLLSIIVAVAPPAWSYGPWP
jgi:hypothetical protein